MSNPTSASLVAVLPILLLYLYRRLFSGPRYRLPLPPGPKGLPIVGSLFDSSESIHSNDKSTKTHKPIWERYLDLGKRFNSDIVHINVLGDHMVVLNSANATNELLEKRSANYSSRPAYHMLNGLCGWGWNFAHMRYSDYWRLHRKTFHQYFQSRALDKFHPFHRKAVLELVESLMRSSKNGETEFKGPLQRYAGSIILRATYGITTREEQDRYVSLVNRAVIGIVHAGNHGSYLVDRLPLLKWIPSWFPGAGFKRNAKIWAENSTILRDEPWEKLQASCAAGTAIPCFATENLNKLKRSDTKMEEVIKNCTSFAYLAATDTTVSLLLSTVLSLLHNPGVQARAQKELDMVTGTSRLPDFDDRENLPYIEAIFLEGVRIHQVLPLVVPHHSIEDDVYEGYFIPKGTTVVGNSWAILHDEVAYPDPFKFNPERFMKKEGEELPPSPLLFAFGYGRRQCPGRPFAADTAWLAIACLLATFNIKNAMDHNGNETKAEIEYTEGMISHPKDFKCQFVPRFSEPLENTKMTFQHGEIAD
ncbi:cytochrome P450 [Dendrothele bispora CBS 962.96]|uniref:Cytochrome P450 n=1 Tax=Dendrothele bispora (strain CBS 962.96) TaxID=1314807 RepID=A0A4V4HDB9_DENBC|nr:cytochrome P450 [Dendrothele bispora CBS 962.96]